MFLCTYYIISGYCKPRSLNCVYSTWCRSIQASSRRGSHRDKTARQDHDHTPATRNNASPRRTIRSVMSRKERAAMVHVVYQGRSPSIPCKFLTPPSSYSRALWAKITTTVPEYSSPYNYHLFGIIVIIIIHTFDFLPLDETA
jgi:hypothetical protein